MPRAPRNALLFLPIPTPWGAFRAGYSTRGLVRLDFPEATRSKPRAASATASNPIGAWHRLTTAALQEALAGRTPRHLPPLDWSEATPFQRRVWRALTRLATGETLSYSALARRVGCPGGARAVGGACAANPIPVLVPCHRVLSANGRLGGFSAGLVWKRRLLRREGVVLG
ncbi:MAG: methylated-DNA--[protein]-cysteine S-methyltransferase [Verrucomicrobiae bacterium]|nr:methylated-DNA--[protein]-cysteine S-methyltransferase [Verrucomicrobiae bacterium]